MDRESVSTATTTNPAVHRRLCEKPRSANTAGLICAILLFDAFELVDRSILPSGCRAPAGRGEFPFSLLPVGGGADQVFAVAGSEDGGVEFALQQVMDRVFETAGEQLLLQIDGEVSRADVDCFVAGHRTRLISTTGSSLVISDGSRHDASMTRIFLHRR